MPKKNKKTNIVGVSGEYFVAAELSQMGIVATLTLKNTPSVDILATDLEKGISLSIQVKTMSIDNEAGWHLSEKDEQSSKVKNHFYVLVNLKGRGSLPEYFIIPQRKLSEFLKTDYEQWIGGKKKDGTDRKNTSMRIFDPNRRPHVRKFAEKYRDAWNLLKLG